MSASEATQLKILKVLRFIARVLAEREHEHKEFKDIDVQTETS